MIIEDVYFDVLVQPKSSLYKQLRASPIQSPSLSSDASSDDEIADIHARRSANNPMDQIDEIADIHARRSANNQMDQIQQLRGLVNAPLLHLSQSPIEPCLLGM